LRIAAESAEKMGLEAPCLHLAKNLYERLCAIGFEDEGTQALYRLYKG